MESDFEFGSTMYTGPEYHWSSRELDEVEGLQNIVNAYRRERREWVREHGYPPPLSRRARLRLWRLTIHYRCRVTAEAFRRA